MFALPAGYAGPPAPLAPAVMNRDAEGRATVRAVRVTQPIRIDGALDEAVCRDVPSLTGFIQVEPRSGWAPCAHRQTITLPERRRDKRRQR